jgi:hypothetical protein
MIWAERLSVSGNILIVAPSQALDGCMQRKTSSRSPKKTIPCFPSPLAEGKGKGVHPRRWRIPGRLLKEQLSAISLYGVQESILFGPNR